MSLLTYKNFWPIRPYNDDSSNADDRHEARSFTKPHGRENVLVVKLTIATRRLPCMTHAEFTAYTIDNDGSLARRYPIPIKRGSSCR